VAVFLELVVAAEWLELREAEGRIAERAAKMIVHVDIVESELGLVEDP
jgi:hypothetical protein